MLVTLLEPSKHAAVLEHSHRHHVSHVIALCRGGQRGRHNQGGYYGNSSQGMSHQRQFQQQRNSPGPYQSMEAQSSMPVGTKLQGHVESVKSKFGFIRCVNAEQLCPSGSSVMTQAIIQLLHTHALQAGHPAHVLPSAEHSLESFLIPCRVPTASEPIFFHMSELRVNGKHLSNGTTSAPQAAQEHISGTASQSEEQPASEVHGLWPLLSARRSVTLPASQAAPCQKYSQACKWGAT